MRIATFNILHGRSIRDGRVDLGRFAAAISDLDADVLALQEVDRNNPRSRCGDLAMIAAEAMGAQNVGFVPALRFTPALGFTPARRSAGSGTTAASRAEDPTAGAYGVALLTRYPATGWRAFRFPVPPSGRLRLRTDHRGVVLSREEARAAVSAVVSTPRGELTIASTHLSLTPGFNALQLRALARRVYEGSPTIIAGDLNMGSTMAAASSGFRALAGAAPVPVELPRRRIDHLLARGVSAPHAIATAREMPVSDHRALVVDL